ncbi:adenine nucleotide alpha hydrolases-like protein [Hortaea werneckii]|nr:adenine nucleotide alpha hydrolases-like protein [Hortaea werneckii]KAI7098098.1 adenine nucleotide alpha hydrolases-like protein [Hortaea werneckii]KAI7239738.1 adenine nucleotide alpha hydrolases-like protein [Hortaea werneckii]KAI7323410.1 adenine nucleotide alpha hydrolases-like protein [Hortaea werneckii]KAI7376253.1 adenine nucleotide alpha hydrolases-like protein [Hortaea werneckii]
MPGLQVVALISGGKDSLFSILHCQANGHEVVALANLYPAKSDVNVEDTDSYMYQTIGHAVIPLYEKALGLPLFRQEIMGTAVDQNRSYGPQAPATGASEDETESLVPLLQQVKAALPGVNAVSTGAIMSDYQRTRVESVALRLGLTPLSYLWQWPSLSQNTQSSLLEDMAAVGQDSRIIKVASGGLDDSFLWQNVAERRTISRLAKAAERFGSYDTGAIIGEGGEFETLAVDGPTPLWKHRISVGEDEREIVPGEAGTASIRFRHPRLEAKGDVNPQPIKPRIPETLDERSQSILKSILSHSEATEATQAAGASPEPSIHMEEQKAVPGLITGRSAAGQSPAAQMQSIMDTLRTELEQALPGIGVASIVYTSIILRNMADFADINAVYGRYFTLTTPPARVTIACADAIPSGCDVMLGATYSTSRSQSTATRRGLHVQSRSYWAPANIGPYSQAFVLQSNQDVDRGDVLYVAGQIPLIPASMELASSQSKDALATFAYQAVIALQHADRIGIVMSSKRWAAGIAFIVAPGAEDARKLGLVARRTWSVWHETGDVSAEDNSDEQEDEGFDVWHVTQNFARSGLANRQPEQDRQSTRPQQTPPLWVIEVDALPRGASIEWALYGCMTEQNVAVEKIPHLCHLLDVFQRQLV